MLYITDNSIALTRGDTAYLTVPIEINGESYTMNAEDTLTLSVKSSAKDEDYCFQCISTGENTIHIKPSDTAPLDFKKYKYDVQLNMSNGDVFTVIPFDIFEVLPEVTR